MTKDEKELVDLASRSQQFLRMLELSGIDESAAVTAVHNACVLRLVRSSGAPAAAAWLRRVADLVDNNSARYEMVAQR